MHGNKHGRKIMNEVFKTRRKIAMKSKKIMALVLSLTVIMGSNLCVNAAGSGYGGSGYSQSASSSQKSSKKESRQEKDIVNQETNSGQEINVFSGNGSSDSGSSSSGSSENNISRNIVKRADGTVLQSTVAGRYTSKNFAGTSVSSVKASVNAALGVKNGETAWVSISDSTCGEKAMKTVTEVSESMGAKVAGILDIYGSKITKSGKRVDVNQPEAGIEYTVGIPASMKAPAGYQLAILRVYGDKGVGKADLLKDMDNDPNTVTFSSDKFGVFAFVYIRNL